MNIYQHSLMAMVALIAIIVAVRFNENRYPITHTIAIGILSGIASGYTVAGFILAFTALGAL